MGRRKARRPTVHHGEDGYYHAWMAVGSRRTHISRPTADEVEDEIDKLLAEKALGHVRQKGKAPTVAEWMEEYFGTTEVRKRLSPKSLYDYRSKNRNWIVPHLGKIRLPDLDTADLDRLYAAMEDVGRAESHVLKVHRILCRALDIAVRRDKVLRNVARLMDPPGSTKPRLLIDSYTEGEIKAIVPVAAARRNGTRWLCAMATGTRQGETLALRWELLDQDTGECDISWQLQRLPWQHGCDDPHACGAQPREKRPRGLHRLEPCAPGGCSVHKRNKRGCPPPCRPGCTGHAKACPNKKGGGLVFRRPKGDKARISVIPPELLPLLSRHHLAQKKERMAAPRWYDHDLVWCNPDGTPIDPRDDWGEWQEILTHAGLSPSRIHRLRHTAGTQMIIAGIDIRVVMEALGHADIRMTQGYTKLAAPTLHKAAKAMGKHLFGP